MKCSLLVAIILALHATVSSAAPIRSGGPLRIEAVELTVANAVKLDGDLSDAAWERAPAITGFLQRDPHEGAPASQATEVRVLYDTTHLYIAVRALDSDPSRLVGIRTRRDAESPSDWIRIVVDSYHDRRTAYEFAVNPAGVKQDRYWFNDGSSDQSWDAVWDVSVTRDDRGWSAEFRVPFSQLRFEPGKRETFGFAAVREIGRLNETSTWPLIAKSRTGFVSQFGDLGGLKLNGSAKRLELVPYSVGQLQTQPVEPGNPFQSSPSPAGSIGADLKYAVTPGLTLTSTVNPDFGQVEADPAVVNLTAFETFYQERRPFFVEGSGTLTFDLDCNDGSCTGLFYSRRIGRPPHGSADAPASGFASTSAQTTIFGAAKLTGRLGAFSIGAMDAVTSSEQAHLALGTRRWSQTIEPLTNYAVAQARREWSNQSTLGFMLTSTTRALDDETPVLAKQAVTSGASWDWRLKDPRFAIVGYWAGSSIHGSGEAIDQLQTGAVHGYDRVDAGHLAYDPSRTSLNGHAGQIAISKVGGKRVRFNVAADYKTPGFDVNDVGYVRRADAIQQSAWVQIRWDTPTKTYRSIRLNLNQWSGWNFDGDSRYRGVNVNAHVTLLSNWTTGAGFNVEGRGVDDRGARGGPAFTSKSGLNGWAYVESDSRKVVIASVAGFSFGDETGSSVWGTDATVTWRPTSFLSLSGGWHVEKLNEDTQWVSKIEEAGTTHYVFGRIRQTTVGLTSRVNYTITPALTVQVYGAPFVSAGAYTDYRELVRPRNGSVSGQFDPYPYAESPNFNYLSFRMTNVVRWEYKPGSALYVVWQQGRESVGDAGQFRFGHDFGRALNTPGSNVFLVKASYWFNF